MVPVRTPSSGGLEFPASTSRSQQLEAFNDTDRVSLVINDYGVATIECKNHPVPCLSVDLCEELTHAIRWASQCEEALVTVLTFSREGKGRNLFCAGADIQEFIKASDKLVDEGDRGYARDYLAKFIQPMFAVRESKNPVLLLVHGKAQGGILSVIGVADEVYAIDKVEELAALSEIKLGILPATISLPVSQRLDPRVFKQWARDGQFRSSEECLDAGLVDHLCDSQDDLDLAVFGRAKELAKTLAKKSDPALGRVPEMLSNLDPRDWKEIIAKQLEITVDLLQTEQCREQIEKYRPASQKLLRAVDQGLKDALRKAGRSTDSYFGPTVLTSGILKAFADELRKAGIESIQDPSELRVKLGDLVDNINVQFMSALSASLHPRLEIVGDVGDRQGFSVELGSVIVPGRDQSGVVIAMFVPPGHGLPALRYPEVNTMTGDPVIPGAFTQVLSRTPVYYYGSNQVLQVLDKSKPTYIDPAGGRARFGGIQNKGTAILIQVQTARAES